MVRSPLSSILGDGSFVPVPVSAAGRVLHHDIRRVAADERNKWFVIAPDQVRLHPQFAEIVLRESSSRPDIDLYYGDEVAPGNGPDDRRVIVKPALDLTLLIADDYIGLPLIVRGSAMHRLGGLRPTANTAAAYDLVLRAISAGLGIGRITEVLAVHPGPRPRPEIDDRLAALRVWLAESADRFYLGNGLAPGTVQLKRHFTSFPDVTLLIPTCQSGQKQVSGDATIEPFIISLLNSLGCTKWPMEKLHVLIGDDLRDDEIYRDRQWPFHVDRMVTARQRDEKFNYAAKMNRLWRAAASDHVVLMNDDMVIRWGDWLQALLTFSMQEDVGGVGARLLYPNGTIQHAGMPGGLFDLCAHAWMGQSATAPTYQDWAAVHREWSIVTGALFATRKSVLEIVNGFDERFSLEFNDVDLCLRLRMLGYRIVYTPFAELIHYEKASRGEVLPPGSELALFWKRWSGFLAQDPAYHPRLTRRSFQIAPIEHADDWWNDGSGQS